MSLLGLTDTTRTERRKEASFLIHIRVAATPLHLALGCDEVVYRGRKEKSAGNETRDGRCKQLKKATSTYSITDTSVDIILTRYQTA